MDGANVAKKQDGSAFLWVLGALVLLPNLQSVLSIFNTAVSAAAGVATTAKDAADTLSMTPVGLPTTQTEGRDLSLILIEQSFWDGSISTADGFAGWVKWVPFVRLLPGMGKTNAIRLKVWDRFTGAPVAGATISGSPRQRQLERGLITATTDVAGWAQILYTLPHDILLGSSDDDVLFVANAPGYKSSPQLLVS